MRAFSSLERVVKYAKKAFSRTLLVGSFALPLLYSCGCRNELPYVPPEHQADGIYVPPGGDSPADPVPIEPPKPEPGCQSPQLLLEGRIDFYTAMEQANVFARNFPQYLNGLSFDPNVADANGPYDFGTNSVVPNGIPDLQEFTLISIVLNNPGLDLRPYGGIDYLTAVDAWNTNVDQTAEDFGTAALALVRGAEMVLPGYMTLGDDNSVYITDHMADMAIEYTPFLGVKPVDPNNYARLPQFFSYYGDADGDGTSNIDEYSYSIANRLDYASIALDPCKP